MKVTREQAAENRERVLALAGEAFRTHGFDGIGVAVLMRTAGLTHGAFYGQFESKEALMAEAVERALERTLSGLARLAESEPEAPRDAVVRSYLSAAHRDRPALGCVVAALGAETPRKGPEIRAALTRGLRRQIDWLQALTPGRGAARRRRALATLATLTGAMMMARAVDDPALSAEILEAARTTLGVGAKAAS